MGAASNRSLRPALIAAALLAAALFLALLPARAYADSYECPRVDLTAQAQSDGSLHVVEQRMFDFSGEFSAVWWTFSGLPWNADVAINSMRVAAVDADGNLTGEWEDLPETPFQIGWRDSGGPSEAAWSFDEVRNTVYAFADFTDARLLIELDYTVENGVQAYDDIVTNISLDRLKAMYDVNVFTPMLLTKYAIRNMIFNRVGGSIVHISSISAHTGYKGLAMYASSKGALEAFSKNTAREWGEKGVRSNVVVPGFMDTAMSSTLSDEQKNRIYKRTSLKKATEVASVAETVAFLLSDRARSITGQNINVDAGTI